MGLLRDIGGGPVALDTCVFIYFIEEHPEYLALLEPVFQAIDDPQQPLKALTSSLTLLEVLVVPFRAGDQALAERYESLLVHSRGLRLIELDTAIMRAAALLRARVRIKTPDALQLSAALSAACPVFVTNDRALPTLPHLRVLQLSDYR